MQIAFMKMQGLGNDFILCDGQDFDSSTDFAALAQKLCHRHFGVGADGLILNWPDPAAHARMQIFNSDGSEAEMCGNGLRCFARYLNFKNSAPQSEGFKVQTGAGLLTAYLREANEVEVNMGRPILEQERIPARGFDVSPVVQAPLFCGEYSFQVTLVSMGNPHCVIQVPSLERFAFEEWGPRLEKHRAFPARSNIEFVEVISPKEVRVKVWERGAGPTLACGTGACAVAVAGVLGEWLEPHVVVHLPGGPLKISWPEPDGPVWMSGPAELVFQGVLELEQHHGS